MSGIRSDTPFYNSGLRHGYQSHREFCLLDKRHVARLALNFGLNGRRYFWGDSNTGDGAGIRMSKNLLIEIVTKSLDPNREELKIICDLVNSLR